MPFGADTGNVKLIGFCFLPVYKIINKFDFIKGTVSWINILICFCCGAYFYRRL